MSDRLPVTTVHRDEDTEPWSTVTFLTAANEESIFEEEEEEEGGREGGGGGEEIEEEARLKGQPEKWKF